MSLLQYGLFLGPEIEMESYTFQEPLSQDRMFFAYRPSLPLGPSERDPD